MRGGAGIAVLLAGCGRIAFDPAGAGGVFDPDGGGLAGDGVAALCTPHPMLGTSGCLSGSGPFDLWLFADVVGGVVADRSGRGCVLLRSAGTQVADGIDVKAGAVTATVGDPAATFDAIAAAQGVTLELWAHTVATPPSTVDLVRAADAVKSRIRIVMSATDSLGNVDGLGIGFGYGTRDPRDGITRQFLTFGNPAGVGYSLSNFQATISGATGPMFPWQPATSTIAFGPWDGTIVRAAIYDRILTDPEIACLNTAGAGAIP